MYTLNILLNLMMYIVKMVMKQPQNDYNIVKISKFCDSMLPIFPNHWGFARKNSQLLNFAIFPKWPEKGLCWTDTMKALVSGCKQLSDVEQSRLALSYLNCFLLVQGRRHYNCDPSDDIKTCTVSMTDADSASYATFFTHTQNICYFLEAQIWHETTERTISLLSSSSEAVADQLEQSSHLQHEVLQQQKISLENQDRILDQASNLSSIINTSTNSINDLFTEFKETTNEQRQLITDIFDRVSQLQSTVLGEFSWFYSFIYYVLSTVMCYILTSTPRTSGARFWLFCLMTLNTLTENFLINFATEGSILYTFSESSPSQSENNYRFQWVCRKLSACVGLVVLIYYAVTFQDINVLNNKLLTEIKCQNEELKNCLKGKQKKKQPKSNTNSSASVEELNFDALQQGNDTTGYESASHESSGEETLVSQPPKTLSSYSGSSVSTDPSYRQPPGDTDDADSVSSFSTALTSRTEVTRVSTRSSTRSSSLQRELRDLHNSTPFKDLTGNLLHWATSGSYRGQQQTHTDMPPPQTSGREPPNTTRNMKDPTVPHKYLLRQRKPTSVQGNPALQSESPRSFTRKVKHLEKMSARNSRLIRNKIIHEDKLTVSSEEDK